MSYVNVLMLSGTIPKYDFGRKKKKSGEDPDGPAEDPDKELDADELAKYLGLK
ncbi:hypothetical protein FPE01S_02_09040 [Flavihumibacter petaseus NBRC 106054]|uniref:Uncharacterized protein n=1 Tax=Flavihumibacter petaseus NBRC 106054 TaxID=1220578 RepID=A0A0E9N1Z1_9BACT|nr:hypothetical protein FPE01S_02_09040 [Flavihumibacter petaseus NBRC 106054]